MQKVEENRIEDPHFVLRNKFDKGKITNEEFEYLEKMLKKYEGQNILMNGGRKKKKTKKKKKSKKNKK